jgi:flagellar biogenesis protein FliO
MSAETLLIVLMATGSMFFLAWIVFLAWAVRKVAKMEEKEEREELWKWLDR